MNPEQIEQFCDSFLAPYKKELVRASLLTRIGHYGSFALATVAIAALPIFGYRAFTIVEFSDAARLFWEWTLFLGILVFIGVQLNTIKKAGAINFKAIALPKLLEKYSELRGAKLHWDDHDSDSILQEPMALKLLPEFTCSMIDDRITGFYQGNSFTALGMRLRQVKTSSTSGSYQRSNEEVFQGLVARISFKTRASVDCAIFSSEPLSTMAVRAWEKVKLESADFERMFDCYGNDQIEARKFMTPHEIEKWIQFGKQNKSYKLAIGFEANGITIALSQIGDWLDDPIALSTATNIKSSITSVISHLDILFDLIDFLIQVEYK